MGTSEPVLRKMEFEASVVLQGGGENISNLASDVTSASGRQLEGKGGRPRVGYSIKDSCFCRLGDGGNTSSEYVINKGFVVRRPPLSPFSWDSIFFCKGGISRALKK